MMRVRLGKNETVVFKGMTFQAEEAGTYEITHDEHSGVMFAALLKKIPVPGGFEPVKPNSESNEKR